jgi:hypothetical protein
MPKSLKPSKKDQVFLLGAVFLIGGLISCAYGRDGMALVLLGSVLVLSRILQEVFHGWKHPVNPIN